MKVWRRTILVDGLATSYLEAGEGDPVVLLHGGEFGAAAELGWEHTIGALATRFRVIAPDMLGYGHSAKVVDFVDGRGMRIRHIARLCAVLGIDDAYFVGNSAGAVMLVADTTSERPILPVRALVAICGGGEILRNEHTAALFEYDASVPAMRKIVQALFHDPSYPNDDAYVQRRFESSTVPGAWEAIAAARFRRPGPPEAPAPWKKPVYERISVPTLVLEGAGDKLNPSGWSSLMAGEVAGARSVIVENAGHCPQIEQPSVVNELLLDFLA